ncbi:MAG TPA: RnfABCDGE type electron transport complex subunit D [Candidatus Acidoferrales bacterium]|nr:RnfABCDGE type electron transport complex subunit D [Candidatus Acidoferrales bacterium]
MPPDSLFVDLSGSSRKYGPLQPNSPLLRFFRTPKGMLLIILTILIVISQPAARLHFVLPGVFVALIAAAGLDAIILRMAHEEWEFPSGAVLSGLIIAMVLSPHEPWYVFVWTSAIAIASKYIFRTRSANVFNPAAFGLVVTFYMFNTGQSWWGALPEVSPYALIALFAMGIFISDRVKKIPMVLIFLGAYFLLFTVTSYLGDPANAAEIFRTPDFQSVLFFAFFILTDPPTSPVSYRDQMICGAMVAVASYAVFELLGAAYFLLAGVLVGNTWEAWRRWHLASQRRPSDRSSLPQES